MDASRFLMQFHDFMAPRLDTYEQAIYLYLVRHTRLIGDEEGTFPFKSARSRMACGIGEKGAPMSDSTACLKLNSLAQKGAIEIIRTDHAGRRIRVRLPDEISGLIPKEEPHRAPDPETLDFFEVLDNRPLIVEREERRCFYCLREIDPQNTVIEHVVSRPTGNSGYRNVVAACRECNNRKGPVSAEEFIRTLYRDSILSADDFKVRLDKLRDLRSGKLKPDFTRAKLI